MNVDECKAEYQAQQVWREDWAHHAQAGECDHDPDLGTINHIWKDGLARELNHLLT